MSACPSVVYLALNEYWPIWREILKMLFCDRIRFPPTLTVCLPLVQVRSPTIWRFWEFRSTGLKDSHADIAISADAHEREAAEGRRGRALNAIGIIKTEHSKLLRQGLGGGHVVTLEQREVPNAADRHDQVRRPDMVPPRAGVVALHQLVVATAESREPAGTRRPA